MHRAPHPLLEEAKRAAKELEWERTSCDVCSSRGAVGWAGQGRMSRGETRGDEPEPCPGCLGVGYVWIAPGGGLIHIEDLLAEHERLRGSDPPGCAR